MPSEFQSIATADRTRLIEQVPDRTLPAFAYTDPDVLAAEKEALFFRTWQFVCHDSDLAAPGSFFTFSIFDQDLFLVRGQDDRVRGFYNACAHRGHQLVEGVGQKARLVCPYHAWTYDMTGQLIGVRSGPNTTQVSRSGIGLSEVRVERLLDFWFVNLDPDTETLASYAEGLAEDITKTIPGLEQFARNATQAMFGHPFQCNWKTLIDNYLECYHCETAHPTFCDMFHSCDIKHSFARNHMRQHLPSAHKAETKAYRIDLDNDLLDGNFWFLFPSTLLGTVPGHPSISVSRIIPLSPETCARDTQYFLAPGADMARLAERDRFFAEVTVAEDRALVESVQKGMHQRGFDRGHFMIDPDDETFTEEGVRFFHTRYRDAMAAWSG